MRAVPPFVSDSPYQGERMGEWNGAIETRRSLIGYRLVNSKSVVLPVAMGFS